MGYPGGGYPKRIGRLWDEWNLKRSFGVEVISTAEAIGYRVPVKLQPMR